MLARGTPGAAIAPSGAGPPADDFSVTAVAPYHRSVVKHLTPSALLAHARSEGGQRALRYMATSAFGVVVTQILLFAFLHGFEWKPVI